MARGTLTTYPEPVLRDALAFWLRVCRLEEWDVVLKLERGDVFTNKDVSGETAILKQGLQAEILLLDPVSYQADGAACFDYDMLLTLAHEVGHIALWSWKRPERDTTDYVLYEQTVERVGRLLVQLWMRRAAT